MRENLLKIREKAEEEISSAKILNDIENIRVKYLGKKGNLTLLLKDMGKLSKEERPIIGKLANEIRESIEKAIVPVRYIPSLLSSLAGRTSLLKTWLPL